MTDVDIIKAFGGYHALFDLLPVDSRPTYVGVHKWGYHGIPARWRPTIWALLEQRCPEVAAKLNRDTFLGVRLPLPSSREDAA